MIEMAHDRHINNSWWTKGRFEKKTKKKKELDLIGFGIGRTCVLLRGLHSPQHFHFLHLKNQFPFSVRLLATAFPVHPACNTSNSKTYHHSASLTGLTPLKKKHLLAHTPAYHQWLPSAHTPRYTFALKERSLVLSTELCTCMQTDSLHNFGKQNWAADDFEETCVVSPQKQFLFHAWPAASTW